MVGYGKPLVKRRAFCLTRPGRAVLFALDFRGAGEAKYMKRIVVVGSSNTDLVLRLPRLPQAGETVGGGEFFVAAGGKGANQAVAAARCAKRSTRVFWVGCVGEDEYGRAAVRGLKKEGVAVRHVRRVKGARSGVALIFLGQGAENMIGVAGGANLELGPQDVAAAQATISGADFVLCQLEIPRQTVRKLITICHRGKVPLLLNPAPMPPEGLPEALLRKVAILTPNEGEFAALFGADPATKAGQRAAQRAVEGGAPPVLIVTRGEAGVSAFRRGGPPVHLRPPKVKAVDTVGAGDCFNGALAVALGEGAPLADACRFACAAAALAVTKKGAQPALPRRREVDFLLKHSPGG